MITITEKMLQRSMSKDRPGQTPFYIFDKAQFQRNYTALKQAFGREYPNTIIGYSFKTNSTQMVLREAEECGAWAEVVSPGEFLMALRNNLNHPGRVIYNGVIPDTSGKFLVAAAGGIVNIENLTELVELERYASFHNGSSIEVGLRINLSLKDGMEYSRFGFDPSGEDYAKAINLIANSRSIILAGIHCHIHGARDLDMWGRRAELMSEIGGNLGVKYIDLGGNMYGPMEESLRKQFAVPIPTFDDYAKVVGGVMRSKFPGGNVRLVIECGTPLVANTMALVSSVTDVKHSRGRTIATADTSIYDLGFIGNSRAVPYYVVPNEGGEREEVSSVYGYACTEGDVLIHSDAVRLKVGDKIIFQNVGAYTMSLESNFIKQKTPVYSAADLWPPYFK